MFKKRSDFLTNMINTGINPFIGVSLYDAILDDEKPEKIYEIIKKIKTCYYLAYINNVLFFNDKTKSYWSNKGIEIPLKSIANKLGNIVE